MRCPKCGYISFDNVEKCLKCRKNIADAASLFQGSVLNVTTPVFLKFVLDEEEIDEMEETEIDSDELELDDEEIEISDPDLDILLDDEDGGTADIELEMEDESLETSNLDQLNDDLSEIEAFSEEDSDEDEFAPGLGMLDEAETEAGFAADEPEIGLNMEVPDELADLSDLSPPEKAPVVKEPVAEDDVDLDFGDLGDDFGEEAAAAGEEAVAAALATPETAKPKEQKVSLDMDEELDFELDLGGLSIHDEDK